MFSLQDHQLDAKLVYKAAFCFLLAHEVERNSSTGHILELLNQLLIYVRSSAEHDNQNQQNSEPDSMFTNPFVARSMSMSTRSMSLSPTPSSSGPNAAQVDSGQLQQAMNKLCDDIVTICIRIIKLVLDSQRQFPMDPSTGITQAKLSELSDSLA